MFIHSKNDRRQSRLTFWKRERERERESEGREKRMDEELYVIVMSEGMRVVERRIDIVAVSVSIVLCVCVSQ